jgi:hypothetical protein
VQQRLWVSVCGRLEALAEGSLPFGAFSIAKFSSDLASAPAFQTARGSVFLGLSSRAKYLFLSSVQDLLAELASGFISVTCFVSHRQLYSYKQVKV